MLSISAAHAGIELYYNEEMIEKSEIFKNHSKKRNIFELLINIINKVIL